MARKIDQERCIQCGICLPECPNDGITEEAGIYNIEAKLCTDCFGFHEQSQCVTVCPVDAIVEDESVRLEEDEVGALAANLRPDRFPAD